MDSKIRYYSIHQIELKEKIKGRKTNTIRHRLKSNQKDSKRLKQKNKKERKTKGQHFNNSR